jgi:hypothetical protein
MQDGWYDETFFHCIVVQYLIMVISCVLTIHMYLAIRTMLVVLIHKEVQVHL